MTLSPLTLLRSVAVAAASISSAHGQVFFPVGMDHVTYDPRVKGTPAGRIYVGDHLRNGNCHFRLELPAMKTVTQIEMVMYAIGGGIIRGVVVTTGDGRQLLFEDSEFERVDRNGDRCDPVLPFALAAPKQVHGVAGHKIAISNDADSFAVTCDGRMAVVVGANSATPVSLVDFASRQEVDRFAADSNVTGVATFDDGESVVVVQNIPPRNATNRLRRLKVVNQKLVDTGESLAAAAGGDFPDYRFKKVFSVPGSRIGVALAEFGNPQIVTFSVPGLKILDSLASAGGHSGAVSCAGDRVYVRVGSQVRGYTLDPVTGALGKAPVLTIRGIGEIEPFSSNFGNALSISRDGTQLIVSEGTAFPDSPPTPRTTFFDSTTGARLGFFEAFDGGSPTLVSTYPCCSIVGLRLGIQRLASGLIEITSTGNVGSTYELQKSADLTTWSKLLQFQMTVSPSSYIDPDSSTTSTRFYQLKLVE
ncbi:MAG: hypothetical protein JNK85_17430 [Verrucomicrobiales bacterium]|nr:hypothetical protein [Verrucomicrobiales bacterium]